MQIKLTSIIIFVHDVDLLKGFYVDNFKLEIIEEHRSEWVLLNAGNCNIGLHRIGEQYGQDKGSFLSSETNIKLVFEINENISILRQTFLEKGVAMREIKTFENYDFFMCDGEDPEGNVFQLKQRK